MPIQQLDPKLLEILACPACDDRPPLTLSEDRLSLDCAQCSRRYQIEDGIPVLLVERAIFPEGLHHIQS